MLAIERFSGDDNERAMGGGSAHLSPRYLVSGSNSAEE